MDKAYSLQLLGVRIRKLRLDQHMSQEKLAESSGLHRTYIGSIERGEQNVSFINLLRLANALNISLANLFADWDTSS
jgi:transcriptional regulator with XRE-family HTH domain